MSPQGNHPWLNTAFVPSRVISAAKVYEVFKEFSLPPGLVFGTFPPATNSPFVNLPAPISTVYQRLLCAGLEVSGLSGCRFRAECWSTRSNHVTQSVEYHLDLDELEKRNSDLVVTPAYGIIYYAGPTEGAIGGTYFNPPIYDFESDHLLFTSPDFDMCKRPDGVTVSFLPGKIVIFRGNCPHCVEPFSHAALPRVTLLINLWALDPLP